MAIYRRTYSGTLGEGGTFSFGFHVNGGAGTLAAAQTAAENWMSTFWGSLVTAANAVFPASDVVTQVKTYQYADVTTHSSFVSHNPNFHPDTYRVVAGRETAVNYVGAAAGNSMPPDSAILVSLRTDTLGRIGRGRFYLPTPATDQCDANGLLLAASRDVIITALNAAFAGDGGAWPAVVWRNYSVLGPIPPAAAVVPLPVTSTLVGTTLQRQSERLRLTGNIRAAGAG